MKTTITLCSLLALAGSASASLMLPGYTVGSGLLSPGGETLFVDTAALGGAVDPNDLDGFAPFFSVLIDGAGLWDIGDTVEISGFALALRGTTANGTMTFDIRQGAGGIGASGAGSLASLGTATADFTGSGTTSTYYANFDTPVSFVVDANTTSIGINFSNTGNLSIKADASYPVPRYNYSNGNLVGDGMRVSVAGVVTAIPEPGTLGLLGLAFLLLRRRFRGN